MPWSPQMGVMCTQNAIVNVHIFPVSSYWWHWYWKQYSLDRISETHIILICVRLQLPVARATGCKLLVYTYQNISTSRVGFDLSGKSFQVWLHDALLRYQICHYNMDLKLSRLFDWIFIKCNAYMILPAVRFDLNGGLLTCLYFIIYQEYNVICIFAKRM